MTKRDEADPLAVDVSIVHPLHLSSLKAVVTPGETEDQAEKAKSAHSKESCRQAGWRFTGACAETTGAWGPAARKLVLQLIQRQAMRLGVPVAEAAQLAWRRLNTALMKGTASMLLRAFPSAFSSNPELFDPGKGVKIRV